MRRHSPLPWLSLLLCLMSAVHAQQSSNSSIPPLGDTLFSSLRNFTQCQVPSTFRVVDAQRFVNRTMHEYSLNITGRSLIAVANLSATGDLYASAKTEVLLGNTIVYSRLMPLCPDLAGGCPVAPNDTVEIQHTFMLPNTSLPLGDVIVRYSALTGEMEPWACVTLAPVGYQHPTWRSIFIYLPVALTLFAALVSFFASFATVPDTDHDVFLFTSNYAMLPAALRLKTPGFFDLIYYAQFIVLMGQLNLDYPAFYPLFTANFAWSFLLFPTRWISETATRALFGMGLANRTRQPDDSPHIAVNGTGMNNFAMAAGIDINSLFMTAFIFLLIVMGACLLVCLVIWIVVRAMAWRAPHQYAAQDAKVANFTFGIILRVMTLFYLPMMTLSFCQLMLPAPVVILLFAALVLVFHIFLVYGYVAFVLLDVRPTSLVFSDLTLLLRYGSLYNTFTDDHFHFFLYGLIYRIVIGAVVGWLSIPGLSQILVIFIFEVYLLVLHLTRRPHASRHVNLQHVVFACFRIVSVVLSLVYIEPLGVADVPKQMVAWAQIILHFCMFLLVLFAIPVRNLVVIMTGLADDELYESGAPPARMAWWRRRPRRRSALRSMPVPTTDDDDDGDDDDSGRERRKATRSSAPTLPGARSMSLLSLQSAPLPKRASDPPPPPPPHQSDIQLHHSGWKTAGKKRQSFFNTDEEQQRRSSSSSMQHPLQPLHPQQPSVYQPLINHHIDLTQQPPTSFPRHSGPARRAFD